MTGRTDAVDERAPAAGGVGDGSPETAPAVVAVVVTKDPGPWFEEALEAVSGQDYPNLSVLVIDCGSKEELTRRVASVAPTAFVRRLNSDPGWAAAANEVLRVVEGAPLYLFLHDDVAPAPDAVRALVEQSFRENAGVVAPKLVEWDRPDRLLAVGMTADKVGTPVRLVEPGELDQEQHDGVRDVFVAPSACLLVRADLFATVGGFDEQLRGAGEDVDLSWRAILAGARVVTAPKAVVRHRQAEAEAGASDRATLEARARLRTILKCYSPFWLLLILPQAAALTVAETIAALLTGRRATARGLAGAWWWNIARLGDLRSARSTAQKARGRRDVDLRRMQARGSVRVRTVLRHQLVDDDVDTPDTANRTVASIGREVAGSLRDGSSRQGVIVWSVLALVFVIGSRGLIGARLPAVGQIQPFPSTSALLGRWWSGFHQVGLGHASAPPTAFGILGLLSAVFLGGVGLLQQVLVLGALPVGVIGAARLARPLGSRRAVLAAAVVYASVPLAVDAIDGGRWQGLVLYAASPWILRRLLAIEDQAPYAAGTPDLRHDALALGFLLALVTAIAPAAPLVVAVVVVGLLAGSAIALERAGSARLVTTAGAAIGVSLVLLFPWALSALLGSGRGWAAIVGVARPEAAAPGLGALLRFDLGRVGHPVLGWAFFVAAALPLVVGRDWRQRAALRLWFVALVCIGVAWAGGRGWIGVPVPDPTLLLAPAAAAFAGSAALGLSAFEIDLPGYRFGWRQVASLAAGAAVILGTLPMLVAAANGRWHARHTDVPGQLSYLDGDTAKGSFRVLWIGDPRALPGDGYPLGDGLSYMTSTDGLPDVTSLWPGGDGGPTHLLADAVEVSRSGRTSALGRLLAPMSVRYVVVALRDAPSDESGRDLPVPADLPAALRSQVDLKLVPSDGSLIVYENVAWAPGRAAISQASFDAATGSAPGNGDGIGAARAIDLTGAPPLLPKAAGTLHATGDVPAGTAAILASQPDDGHWVLRIDGHDVKPTKAFGWTMAFPLDGSSGKASLSYRTPLLYHLGLLVQLALWAAAAVTLVRWRRARHRALVAAGLTHRHAAPTPVARKLRADDAGGWAWDDLDDPMGAR